MPHIYLTHEQLKAVKAVYRNAPIIDWAKYEEYRELLLSTPLDTMEDEPTIGEIHAVPAIPDMETT